MNKNGINIFDLGLAIITVIAFIALFITKNIMFAFTALEWFALIFLFAFFSPNSSATTGFLNAISTTWFWPKSRHWLWVCSILFNIIIIIELVQLNAI